MITAAQIRGARAMTGMSVEELATASQLSTSLVETLERHAEATDANALAAIRTVFEGRGILFLASGSQDIGGPGIRLKEWDGGDGTRPENLNATNDD